MFVVSRGSSDSQLEHLIHHLVGDYSAPEVNRCKSCGSLLTYTVLDGAGQTKVRECASIEVRRRYKLG